MDVANIDRLEALDKRYPYGETAALILSAKAAAKTGLVAAFERVSTP
ncbi:hypothetical protein HZU77_013240 [Neisseriaceae bacterium TC5R-5]|nr:hypothetical protein [Neisseriaceae bacterium TC5R-5]